MATTSKPSLKTALTTIFEDLSGKEAAVKADEIAGAIDDYILDVVSKMTGATTVTGQTGSGGPGGPLPIVAQPGTIAAGDLVAN